MVNYKFRLAGSGLLTAIESYEASSAEATHTFTFTAIDFDDVSHLLLVIDGSTTAAQQLLLVFNADTSSLYYTDGTSTTGGAETLLDINAAASGEIFSASELYAANQYYLAYIIIGINKGATLDAPTAIINGSVYGRARQSITRLHADHADISSIEIKTSTSTWKIGTRMTLYKVARS